MLGQLSPLISVTYTCLISALVLVQTAAGGGIGSGAAQDIRISVQVQG